jgi:tRNA(Ile)-lysidine synthase
MTVAEEFQRRLNESWPPETWRDVGVLVAVSGGADSVALLRGLDEQRRLRGSRLMVAHFDHRLRGTESTADRDFVVALCKQLSVECHMGEWTPAEAAGPCPDGVEAAARTARYAFLQSTAERSGCRYIATAHTADDQAETVLHHILRGTGLSGLAGMSRTRPLGVAVTLIRPLLSFRRTDVIAYLADIGQPYRDDATNREPAFTRNRIRLQLLPLLARDYNPRVVESLLRLSSLAADVQAVIDGLVDELAASCVAGRTKGAARRNLVEIDLGSLAETPRHLVRELFVALWREQNWPLQSMGFDEWDQLAEMAAEKPSETCPAKRVFPGAVKAERQPDRLILQRDWE